MTMIPTIAPSATECPKTNRKIVPSLPTCSVGAVAMVIDGASTILPTTPPALFAAHIGRGRRNHRHAVSVRLLLRRCSWTDVRHSTGLKLPTTSDLPRGGRHAHSRRASFEENRLWHQGNPANRLRRLR